MADEVTPFPFAEVEQLRLFWPDMPAGSDDHAELLLKYASQYILDVAPSARNVSPITRERVVIAVVKRSMLAEATGFEGMDSFQGGAGPMQATIRPTNPHGDFYLTKQEKLSLGIGRQQAFSIDLLAQS